MAHSWTRLQTAQTCGQKYRWQYQQGIKERASAASRPLILGSAVHKGIETFLRLKSERPTLTVKGRSVLAVDAVREYIDQETRPNQLRYDDALRIKVMDLEYYEMMREVKKTAVELFEYHAPGIPETWCIAKKNQVFPERYKMTGEAIGEELALEWKIFHEFHHQVGGFSAVSDFTGIVDAVIIDTATGALMLVDWKIKGNFPMDDKAALDGQLHLYAAVLNVHGANIREVCMYQMKSTLPADAEISNVTGEPLTGRAGYATTWEHWKATLPMGIDPEKYADKMMPKMKGFDYFCRPVTSVITRQSNGFALDNALQAVKMVENDTLPAKLSSYECNFCPFARLCDAKRYGGNIETLIDLAYDRAEVSNG